jgi:predicted NAD/FAD-dependent oxidoreductase
MRVAIVGGGISGLSCARGLVAGGHTVRVFDKGRRPGGRAATRRDGAFAFDHGAQYFTTETAEWSAMIATSARAEAVAPWRGCLVSLTGGRADPIQDEQRRWVGIPGMSALPRHLSTDLDIRCGQAVAGLERAGNAWRLIGQDGSVADEAEVVVVAVPAPQAVPLLAASPALADRAAAATMAPCWAVMLGFDRELPLPFDGAFVGDGPLAWISRGRSKPGRSGGEAWVLHASPRWSHDHLEADREAVAEALWHAFRSALGGDVLKPAFAAAHRWRYARVEAPVGEACLFDADQAIGACGDWCLGGKIEAAFLSGRALAERIIHRHAPAPSRERV